MTVEEAIRIIKTGKNFAYDEKYTEAFDMAIKVLDQDSCEDCISRQGVAEVLLKYAHSTEGKAFAEFLVSQINDLPPVTPKLKTDCDCISRSHLIDLLNKKGIPYNAEVNETIMNLPSVQPQTEWIPVNEKLPKNGYQEVLISLEWGIDIGRYSDGEWHSEWINHYDDGNVLAWQPLPKPYHREVDE